MRVKADDPTLSSKDSGVSQEAVDRAVAAVEDLIVEATKSKSKHRFSEAARLCQIGQSLIKTQAKSVGDFVALEVEEEEGENYAPGAVRLRQAMDAYPGPEDEREVRRNNQLTFGPQAQINAEAQRAAIANNEATELERLVSMKGQVPVGRLAIVEARINTLLTNMETRNGQNLPVVPTDVPRGHLALEAGPQDNAAPGVRVDANGGGGDGQAPGAGAQAPDGQALGA